MLNYFNCYLGTAPDGNIQQMRLEHLTGIIPTYTPQKGRKIAQEWYLGILLPILPDCLIDIPEPLLILERNNRDALSRLAILVELLPLLILGQDLHLDGLRHELVVVAVHIDEVVVVEEQGVAGVVGLLVAGVHQSVYHHVAALDLLYHGGFVHFGVVDVEPPPA